MAPRREILAVAANLRLEAVTAEVVEALRREGVRSIVLKGPSVGRWLYDTPRRSTDVDLLVGDRDGAETVLRALGFSADELEEHARNWVRNAAVVDLHVTLVGAEVPPDVLWDTLAGETERMLVGGTEVEVLAPAARALHVALHAAQHGIEVTAAVEDLERALARLDDDLWTDAAALASRLAATSAFAAGLRLLPAGREVAERLRLSRAMGAEVALRAGTPPPVALGLQRLARTRGIRSKVSLLATELVPSASFMRARFPLARRGRAGLAAAYAWRPFWLVGHVGPAIAAWRRARRDSRGAR